VNVEVEELRATVERMERELRADPAVHELISRFDEIAPRFASDLQEVRDELLTRGGALMLIQQVASSGK
jgi:hypothetical protein